MKFDEITFEPEVQESIQAMGFKECTPIQEKAIPVILEGKDLIACAQTGTGKTAAFLLPTLDSLMRTDPGKIKTLVIVPTRELAIQIDQQIEGFSYFCPVTSVPVYGGSEGGSWEQQKQALSSGADIVIATPGRLIQHLNFNYVDLSEVDHLILDEADRMLDMGFFDDLMKIVKHLPKERQTLMFSATMPPKIRQLAQSILNKPEEITIAISKPAEKILQVAYLAYDNQKIQLTLDLLKDKEDLQSIIVFTSRKSNVNDLVRQLKRLGFRADGIHSDLAQPEREEVLRQFKNRNTQIIVATDIISRGIDIDGIDLVINFDVPGDPADYVHRIGRTARAQAEGVAITYISDKDQYEFKRIEELIERDIIKLPPPNAINEHPLYNPPAKKFSRGMKGGKPRHKHTGGGKYTKKPYKKNTQNNKK